MDRSGPRQDTSRAVNPKYHLRGPGSHKAMQRRGQATCPTLQSARTAPTPAEGRAQAEQIRIAKGSLKKCQVSPGACVCVCVRARVPVNTSLRSPMYKPDDHRDYGLNSKGHGVRQTPVVGCQPGLRLLPMGRSEGTGPKGKVHRLLEDLCPVPCLLCDLLFVHLFFWGRGGWEWSRPWAAGEALSTDGTRERSQNQG